MSEDSASEDSASEDSASEDGASQDSAGDGILGFSWRATMALTVALAAGVLVTDTLGPAVAALSVLMFFAGIALMVYSYAVGVRRSRRELVTVPGLFLLQGVAPARVRRNLLWSFAVQCIVAILAASVRLYSLVAFGCLAPTFGLGLVSLWAARHGAFERRPPS